ncbi:twin-arginine translocation pathway signal [Penicillium macrosclerotiorum]|uniref:twin-arginine translocation pathway signal n=1 Tax=Penicillium macrosclerotiorum TaxID=303699 RepID=UPI002547BA9C|nr:twin-arginine translocation pathway signal [Penicillium macrosclerotiorum]KAJ5669608.1 twin-arginine translocation pathway signal [Penicillium macrosclerotiorum]
MGVHKCKSVKLPSGVKIFYREAIPEKETDSPAILLLHGFPSSSHQFRNLIPLLATTHRVISPDLPGFGFTEMPPDFVYTFTSLTDAIEEFVDELCILKFSIYVFDYGAPVGLRLALRRPEAVQAIISQNGNAYKDGFGDVWDPIKDFWASENTADDRAKVCATMLSFDMTKFQYENGTPDIGTIAPESYHLDYALMQRPGNKKAQIDLLKDYECNISFYPKFHRYFQESQVPLLAIWGQNDVFFIPAGANAFRRDLPKAEIKLLDAGHFAVESHTDLIAYHMLAFLNKHKL